MHPPQKPRKLKGYCVRDAKWRLLVYEYVENKDLFQVLWCKGTTWFQPWPYKIMKQHIFSISCIPNQLKWTCFVLIEQTKDTLILDWPMRFNICMEIARGLAYLHEEVQPCIINQDIKFKNILLDTNFNPKIADLRLYDYSPMGMPTYLH